MVGDIDHNRFLRSGISARQAQRQIVGFAAGTDEETDAQRVRQGGSQPVCIAQDVVVQIPGIGVQRRHLFLTGADNVGVPMSNMAYVVHHVQVRLPLLIVEILPRPPHDFERLAVRNTQVAPQQLTSLLQQCLLVVTLRARQLARFAKLIVCLPVRNLT